MFRSDTDIYDTLWSLETICVCSIESPKMGTLLFVISGMGIVIGCWLFLEGVAAWVCGTWWENTSWLIVSADLWWCGQVG